MSFIHRWEQHPTTGTPPLGVVGYASCHIGKNIFYFAGDCGHVGCYHNSMFFLNTDTLAWSELFPTSETSGPMKKAYCALLAFGGRLLAIGGRGNKAPDNPSPSASYENKYGLIHTNEHHLFLLEGGEHHLSLSHKYMSSTI